MNMVLLERLGTDFTLPERSFGSSSKRSTGDKVVGGVMGVGTLALLGTGIYGSVKAFEGGNLKEFHCEYFSFSFSSALSDELI
jgi:hypothetical protein